MMCEGNSGSSLRLFMAGFWGEYLLVEIDSFAILLEYTTKPIVEIKGKVATTHVLLLCYPLGSQWKLASSASY